MAITVTDEMRQAVHEEDCGRLGHDLALDDAFQFIPGSLSPRLGARDAKTIPHMRCRRCGHVFLILEDGGSDYAEAEAKFKARLKDPSKLRPTQDDSSGPERAPADTPGRFAHHAH